MRVQVVIDRDLPQVGKDLCLARIPAVSVLVGREREAVQVRGDITRAPGVGVVAPDSAQVVGFLDDEVVAEASALQGDGHAEAADPGPDDHHRNTGRDIGIGGSG